MLLHAVLVTFLSAYVHNALVCTWSCIVRLKKKLPLIIRVVTADLSPSPFLPYEQRRDAGFLVFYNNKHFKGKHSLKKHQVSHPDPRFILECPERAGKTPCFGFSVPLPRVQSAQSARGASVNIYCAGPGVHINHRELHSGRHNNKDLLLTHTSDVLTS